jgi:hypothetical protein
MLSTEQYNTYKHDLAKSGDELNHAIAKYDKLKKIIRDHEILTNKQIMREKKIKYAQEMKLKKETMRKLLPTHKTALAEIHDGINPIMKKYKSLIELNKKGEASTNQYSKQYRELSTDMHNLRNTHYQMQRAFEVNCTHQMEMLSDDFDLEPCSCAKRLCKWCGLVNLSNYKEEECPKHRDYC